MRTPSSKRSGARRAGFTLIELMMVISVIMVLMTLLTPGLHRVMARARQTKCLSNLRQQGVGMIGYVAQHGTFPGATEVSSGGWASTWPTRMRAFAGRSNDIFVCPSLPAEYFWQTKFGTGNIYASTNPLHADVTSLYYEPGELLLRINATPFSYGYNYWGTMGAFDVPGTGRCVGMGGDPGWPRPRLSEVARPSLQIVVTDVRATGFFNNAADPSDPGTAPAPTHLGGANVLMADGRAEWIEWNKLVHINRHMPDSHEMRRRWNRDHNAHEAHSPRYGMDCICIRCAPNAAWNAWQR